MGPPRILIVEDEDAIARTLTENLTLEGYYAEAVPSGERALELLAQRTFHLIILDLMLPGSSGYEVCKELRKRKLDVPILILTALGEEHQKIHGLEIGADDYVTKPFSLGELLARVKALLRRAAGHVVEESVHRLGTVRIDLGKYLVTRGKKKHHLSHNECAILRLLVERPGEPVTRSEFLDAIWGVEAFPTNRTVDNYIVRLRRVIEDDPSAPAHILTVYGVGYKFVP